MDCQKFDQVVMDALYEELDELTYAALRRHVESCARCGEAWNGLRATREVAMLPLEEPSPGLEDRILAAVNDAQRTTPWHRKALRALAWAGSHAMRPQLAMAALFFLVIGSSLLLLRAKPGTVGITPVRVTERGVPAPDQGDLEQAPAAAPPVPMAPAPMAAAEAAEGSKKGKEEAADKASTKDTDGAGKALADARATRDGSGCDAALRLYDDVGSRFPGTPQAADAMWEAAQCQRSLGNTDRARELYSALKQSDGYKARAEEALKESDAQTQTNAGGGAVANRAAAPSPAPPAATATVAGAAAGKPAAAAPMEDEAQKARAAPGGGQGRNVNAAPKRAYQAAPDTAAGY